MKFTNKITQLAKLIEEENNVQIGRFISIKRPFFSIIIMKVIIEGRHVLSLTILNFVKCFYLLIAGTLTSQRVKALYR